MSIVTPKRLSWAGHLSKRIGIGYNPVNLLEPVFPCVYDDPAWLLPKGSSTEVFSSCALLSAEGVIAKLV
jgi:hypothetical protein